jgi:single-strand DNA-binding protein
MAARTRKTTPAEAVGSADRSEVVARNEVLIAGRLAAAAEERVLPSGDPIATLRVIVPRRAQAGGTMRRATGRGTSGRSPESPRGATVDTIDVVCWTAGTRRAALRLPAGVTVEVAGALRRRFFGGPTGRQSRYEVEASSVRRVRGGTTDGT